MSSPASSAPGTPSRQRVSSPITLTPRSKIRALLADSDGSSDDKAPKSPSRKKTLSKSTTGKALFIPPLNDLEDSDYAEPVSSSMRSRKLASRVRAVTATPSVPNDEGISAYERVKQSLLAENSPKSPEDTTRTEGNNHSNDEDEEIPIAPRRKRAPKAAASSRISSPARSSVASQRSSPTLSSRASSPKPSEDSNSDELPEDLTKSARFLALVDKRRKEREAKEATERKKEEDQGSLSSEDDADNDRRMASQPTRRKAGKKALEEMHKESQRLARNMQLEHEARTRKKITKQSLFDKFNFKVTGDLPSASEPGCSVGNLKTNSRNPIVPSEFEVVTKSTPGSSQPPESAGEEENQQNIEDTEDLPDALDVLNPTPSAAQKRSKSLEAEGIQCPNLDKGKGKAIESPLKVSKGKGKISERPPQSKPQKPLPNVKIHLSIRSIIDDSDSDLEIVDPEKQAQDEAEHLLREKQKLIASMHRPRPIPKATAGSPSGKTKVTLKQMHLQLLQKGRLQAIREREEKIEGLKAKGIIVQTAEEREREQQEVESLLEKARKEALEIKRREKKEQKLAKVEKVRNNESEDGDFEWMEEEEDVVSLDESEAVYSDEDEERNEVVDGEADESGSDQEDDMEMREAPPMDPVSPAFSLSSVLREQNSMSPTPRLSDMPLALIVDEDSADDDGGFAPFKRKLPRKKQRVTDEDDEDENTARPDAVPPASQQVPKILDIFKNAAQAPAMGMTQLFAGTLGSSAASETLGGNAEKRVDEMRKLPDEILPNSQAPNFADEAHVVPNTQVDGGLSLDYSQSQSDSQDSLPVLTLNYSQSQVMDSKPTQHFPDPTQDTGFEADSSPAPPRFEASPEPPEGSVSTQVLDEHLETKKPSRGRLVRRAAADFSDEEKESDADEDGDGAEDICGVDDAFTVLKNAARKPKFLAKSFDKSKSEAKEMIDERAIESDDEYGGIGGGGSEDEPEDEAMGDEEMKDLLDDREQDIDENAMAAFFAQREKLQDEKDVNRLFRNIQNGMLRKRGANFDLDDDSDDEYIAQERRRRAKRRQIAQIRKALLQNETLGKIAEDPKKAAFFRSLEDNASDEDDDFLDKTEEDLFANLRDDSQSQIPPESQGEEPAASQGNSSGDGPPHQVQPRDPRRLERAKKPGLDIRETLSLLGVQENTLIDLSGSESGDDSQRRRTTTAVIDRTLLRTSSSISVSTKLAFQTVDNSSTPAGFKVPLLLRRATNSSISTDSQNSVAAATERSLGDSHGLKKGGKKSSSINFHARAKIVGDGVGKAEVRKLKERKKEVRNRARGGGLGSLGRGAFS